MALKFKSTKAAGIMLAFTATVLVGAAQAFADSTITYAFPSSGTVNGGTATKSSSFTQTGQSGNLIYIPGFNNVTGPYAGTTLHQVDLTISISSIGASSTWQNNTGGDLTAVTTSNSTTLKFFDSSGPQPLGSGNITIGGSTSTVADYAASGGTNEQTLNGTYSASKTTTFTTSLANWLNTGFMVVDYSHIQKYTNDSGDPSFTLVTYTDPNIQISGTVKYYYSAAPVPSALFLGLIPLAGMVALQAQRRNRRKDQGLTPAV